MNKLIKRARVVVLADHLDFVEVQYEVTEVLKVHEPGLRGPAPECQRQIDFHAALLLYHSFLRQFFKLGRGYL